MKGTRKDKMIKKTISKLAVRLLKLYNIPSGESSLAMAFLLIESRLACVLSPVLVLTERERKKILRRVNGDGFLLKKILVVGWETLH